MCAADDRDRIRRELAQKTGSKVTGHPNAPVGRRIPRKVTCVHTSAHRSVAQTPRELAGHDARGRVNKEQILKAIGEGTNERHGLRNAFRKPVCLIKLEYLFSDQPVKVLLVVSGLESYLCQSSLGYSNDTVGAFDLNNPICEIRGCSRRN